MRRFQPWPAFLFCFLILLFVPTDALAWGAGVHMTIGSQVLANLSSLPPQVAALLAAYPDDFLYGCIGADIIVGKKFTRYLKHCHSWRVGRQVLNSARSDYQRACGYGYLAHLAADTVAHGFFVPYKMVRTFKTPLLQHAYWELRVEADVDPKMWADAKRVARHNFHSNDILLREVLSNTLFSFGTNKRIFNSLLLLNRLKYWQRLLQVMSKRSRWSLAPEDQEEYLSLAQQATFSILTEMERSPYWRSDPTGRRALGAAKVIRKNLNLLWLDGRLTPEEEERQLTDLRQRFRAGLTDPDQLFDLLS